MSAFKSPFPMRTFFLSFRSHVVQAEADYR